MSGVQDGTRLEQLIRLRRRIDQEIKIEARRDAIGEPGPRPIRVRVVTSPAPASPRPASQLINLIPSRTIRAWADENGYLVGPRGPIPERVRLAFKAAHQATEDTNV